MSDREKAIEAALIALLAELKKSGSMMCAWHGSPGDRGDREILKPCVCHETIVASRAALALPSSRREEPVAERCPTCGNFNRLDPLGCRDAWHYPIRRGAS